MKKIAILTILTLLAFSLHAQRQPRLGSYNLYDRVKKVVSITTYFGANDMNYQESFVFDTAGNLKTYRRKGFANETVINYPTEVEHDTLVRTIFDKDNDIVEKRQYHPDGTLFHSTHYVYSAPHQLIMTIDYEYSEEGVIVVRTLTEYDKYRNVLSVRKYTPDEVQLLDETYTYDRYYNPIRKVQIFYDEVADTQTKIVEERKYKYDRYGNWYSQQYLLNGKKRYSIDRKIEYYSHNRK